MKVVTFGDKPAPAMAQIALKQTAEEGETKYPKAAFVLKENVYMDDICTSVKTVEEASRLTKEIDVLLSNGGFQVKEWWSNKHLDNNVDYTQDEKLLEAQVEGKVLGVLWNPKNDCFTYRVKLSEKVISTNQEEDVALKLTKRMVLSQVACIFDPMGFAAPFIIRAKIGIQRLWQKGIDWDTALEENDKLEWIRLFEEMKNLKDVTFKRCLTPKNASAYFRMHLKMHLRLVPT